jgi:hypothetical protein
MSKFLFDLILAVVLSIAWDKHHRNQDTQRQNTKFSKGEIELVCLAKSKQDSTEK